MNIVILGAPASGKGTQAELLVKKYNLFHLQTGEIARNLAKSDMRIREIINSGKLIPEQEMTMYVIDFLTNQKPGMSNILFEGFPRFISQYEALENFLKTKGDNLDAVISLDLDSVQAIQRISARRICQKCGKVYNLITNPPEIEGKCNCDGELVQRDDDKPEAIKVRFQYYQDNTKQLIDYLDKKGKLIRVDGSRSISEVFEEITQKLEAI